MCGQQTADSRQGAYLHGGLHGGLHGARSERVCLWTRAARSSKGQRSNSISIRPPKLTGQLGEGNLMRIRQGRRIGGALEVQTGQTGSQNKWAASLVHLWRFARDFRPSGAFGSVWEPESSVQSGSLGAAQLEGPKSEPLWSLWWQLSLLLLLLLFLSRLLFFCSPMQTGLQTCRQTRLQSGSDWTRD